jgi:hypothetical protein
LPEAGYRRLHRRNPPARDAEGTARLAERRGHRLEAVVFPSAALADDPERLELGRTLAHLEAINRESPAASRSLFHQIAAIDRGAGVRAGSGRL